MKMPKKMKLSYLLNFLGLVLLFSIFVLMFESKIFGTSTTYIKGIFTTACYTIIMVTSLNLVVGCMGEFSLGHAGFVSVGAYFYSRRPGGRSDRHFSGNSGAAFAGRLPGHRHGSFCRNHSRCFL